MLALFTRSWRRKAAIVALVFYALGSVMPAAALALTDTGSHCPPMAATMDAAGAHHGHGQATAGHLLHASPAGDEHDMTGKCCGTFCFTALAPHVAPIAAPPMRVTALSPFHIAPLLGHGTDPIDRPPRTLRPI